ncbi:isoprenylcysteine carboxylmethyltransferase family protein [Acidipila sp. EB88]|uniref:methyltransferase family protein n=1 Tax=Acidipila sp. EB88 TaxID=2305226 RepID=UPI000F5D9B81|nr:isoprenylcysteine carboxylmethyltransferase family protein [Acidipila sp. EB88]RRA48632.1 isoprenylcysteine carboxylmethyltransferase family protein [Acidipila sp. EB88]
MTTQAATSPIHWQRIAKRIRVPLGFAFAVVFLLLATPAWHSLAWSLLLVLPGLLLRGYASGYVKKNQELTTTGPYAWTRNPLYLGSMLIAFGFALGARSVLLAALLALLFAIIYVPVIRGEESFLRAQFPGFDHYAARVPRLVPWRAPLRSAAERGRFAPALYRKHREYNASMGVAALYLALILRLSFQHGR